VTRLVILGAGGHGKVVADAAACQGCWSDIVFLDDRWPNVIKSGAWSIIGSIADHVSHISNKDSVVVAIGSSSVRLALLEQLVQINVKIATVVHPSAVVSQYAQIGAGSVIFANAVVNIDAVLGLGCIVNTGAVIEHDVVFGDGVHVCPNASVAGGVTIGNGTWVGIGSCVRQGVSIGSDVVIGAGAAVVSNILDKLTVIGIPAKPKI
jgi:sugar O-acyltransferase (sialic acid O-acetyltransferase NeuD family)